MQIPIESLIPEACPKCGYSLTIVCANGPHLSKSCVQCNKFIGHVSRVDAGVKERTSQSIHSSIPERIKNEVRMRAGCKCEICGVPSYKTQLHIAHLISVNDGLRFHIPTSILNSLENLALFCDECNLNMGSETVPLRIAVIITAIRTRSKLSNFQAIINNSSQE